MNIRFNCPVAQAAQLEKTLAALQRGEDGVNMPRSAAELRRGGPWIIVIVVSVVDAFRCVCVCFCG